MCGIAGIYNHTGISHDAQDLLLGMLATIQYRGPDERGIYINSNIALGNVRLCILDIKTGQQPMCSDDGKYWIVFNGEIFNYIELKEILVKAGHYFHTESDTEVLLKAFIQYGAGCLNMLNGQFVFAIWNNIEKELFIARDRLGIRPLFYTKAHNSFLFGSEIKSLVEHPAVSTEIDPVSLSQIFTFWTTITPKTAFKNIYELPPGHYMKLKNNKNEIQCFWSFRFPGREDLFKGSLNDASDELKKLLEDSVKLRLRSDVKVAAYLSGGLDSATTAAFIKNIAPKTLETYSICFEDPEFDETSFQKEVSQFLGVQHTSFTVKRDDIGSLFPLAVWHSEIPLLRTAPVPMYCLSKMVHESNIKVVITGEGADEMFAGYDIFKEGIIREFWSRQPDSNIRPQLFKKLYPYLAQFKDKDQSMLRLFYGYQLEYTDSPFYSHMVRWKNTSMLHNFFSENIKTAGYGYHEYEKLIEKLPDDFKNYDILSRSQWLETVIFLSGYLLSSQGDRMAMANSVEGRYPFLDYRVIEFANSLPPSYKMYGLNEKFIIKHMMKGKLPESVLKRPKQAYRAPAAMSFFSGPAKEYVAELLSEKDIKTSGIFSWQNINKLLKKITERGSATEIENMALSGIISTQLLYHQYILKDSYKPIIPELKNCVVIHEQNPKYL